MVYVLRAKGVPIQAPHRDSERSPKIEQAITTYKLRFYTQSYHDFKNQKGEYETL